MAALSSQDFNTIADAASFYAKELVDHSIVVLYKNSSTSVESYTAHFGERNFMHLTGVCHTNIKHFDANLFFHLALEKRFIAEDFKMADRHTTRRKLDALESTLKGVTHATMIGTYNNSGPLLITDKIIGSVHSCLGFTTDRATGLNYPNTLLNTDVRHKLRDCHQICAIFRKKKQEESYSEATYIDKKAPWDVLKFPEEFQYLKDIILQYEIQRGKTAQQS